VRAGRPVDIVLTGGLILCGPEELPECRRGNMAVVGRSTDELKRSAWRDAARGLTQQSRTLRLLRRSLVHVRCGSRSLDVLLQFHELDAQGKTMVCIGVFSPAMTAGKQN